MTKAIKQNCLFFKNTLVVSFIYLLFWNCFFFSVWTRVAQHLSEVYLLPPSTPRPPSSLMKTSSKSPRSRATSPTKTIPKPVINMKRPTLGLVVGSILNDNCEPRGATPKCSYQKWSYYRLDGRGIIP